MMSNSEFRNDKCPHCGGPTPFQIDAFCPHCGEPIEDFDLESKFPELSPISSVPIVVDFMGVGFMFRGSRDIDDETGSEVVTHCFCLLFIPVLAFSSYRLAHTSGGQLILGRVPLSATAWFLNLFVLSCMLGVIAFGLWQRGH